MELKRLSNGASKRFSEIARQLDRMCHNVQEKDLSSARPNDP